MQINYFLLEFKSISASRIERRSTPHPQTSTCITDKDMNSNSEALGITSAIPIIGFSADLCVCKLFRVHNMRCHDKLKHIHVSPNQYHKSVQYTLNFIHSVLAENTKHKQHVWSVTHSWKLNPKSSKYNVQPHTAKKPAVVSGHERSAKFASLKHEVSICRPPEPPPWLRLGWIFILSAGQSQLHALYPFSATKEIMRHRDAHTIQNLALKSLENFYIIKCSCDVVHILKWNCMKVQQELLRSEESDYL